MPRSRKPCCSASVSGRYGALMLAGTARPVSTSAPAALASAARAAASRDLPMPASPSRNTTTPEPVCAAESADRSLPNSASRPMSTGHTRSAIRSLSADGPRCGYVAGYVFPPMRLACAELTMGTRQRPGLHPQARRAVTERNRPWEQAASKPNCGRQEHVTGRTTTNQCAHPSMRQFWRRPGSEPALRCSTWAAAEDSRCCSRPGRGAGRVRNRRDQAARGYRIRAGAGRPMSRWRTSKTRYRSTRAAFDVVTAFNSIQFANDPIGVLVNMRKVTKPGGLVGVVVWGPPQLCESAVMFTELGPLLPPAPPDAPKAIAWSEDGQLERLASAAGLEVVAVSDVENPLIYPDLATAVRTQLSSGPARAAITHSGLPGRSRGPHPGVRRQPQARRHLPPGERVPLPDRQGDLTGPPCAGQRTSAAAPPRSSVRPLADRLSHGSTVLRADPLVGRSGISQWFRRTYAPPKLSRLRDAPSRRGASPPAW